MLLGVFFFPNSRENLNQVVFCSGVISVLFVAMFPLEVDAIELVSSIKPTV
jgi:hypothetical protein